MLGREYVAMAATVEEAVAEELILEIEEGGGAVIVVVGI